MEWVKRSGRGFASGYVFLYIYNSSCSVPVSFLVCGIWWEGKRRSDILSVRCSVVAFACRKGLASLFGRIVLLVERMPLQVPLEESDVYLLFMRGLASSSLKTGVISLAL